MVNNKNFITMKAKFIVTIMTVSMIILGACTKEKSYSCDKEIDRWTQDNLEGISNMSRSKFLEYDRNYQRAIFRAFSPKQRKMVWVEKIKDVLALEWSQNETEHLINLLEYIDCRDFIFGDMSQYEDDDFKKFMYRWKEYAYNELGWDTNAVYVIIADPNPLSLQKDNGIVYETLSSRLSYVKTRSEGGNEYYYDCNCNGDYVPLSDDICNLSYACNAKSWGCGDFWTAPCEGLWEKSI